jgi:transcriptional regulator
MYLPHYFEETCIDELHRLIAAHPLSTLAITVDGELMVNHIPMLIDSEDGEFGTLRAHIARTNPLWQQLHGATNAVAIFQGEQSYISPNWYPSKQETGKQVPTWNYAVVHAHGKPRFIDDASWLYKHLEEMTDAQEAGQKLPWKISDAPREFIDKLTNAIVGIEFPITRISGKWKMSQDEIRADQLGVVSNLQARNDQASLTIAGMVAQRMESDEAPR